MGHLDEFKMVPEIPEFWKAEAQRYLLMSRPEQLAYWREKRSKMSENNGFDEYGVWLRYLGSALGISDEYELIPAEILLEETLGRNPHLGDDGAGIDGEGENP